ncbi:MAG TPA: carbohydrate-binding family 9-like protein, partial [Pyrinomonadaceae bacterium]|nr:carbohydrate-binding family 9-like protein [Pyrinomonadaceae bacterium]
MNANRQKLQLLHLKNDFDVTELDSNEWQKAPNVHTEHYWSGEKAAVGRHFSAKLLWSQTALYVRFEANVGEPLVVSEKPDLHSKTHGLWDRDVCEIFVAPDRSVPQKYFEFEIAPNGEWIDIAIDAANGKREADWDYNSGMRSAARIEKDRVISAIMIEWQAFGRTPKTGDIWLGNLYRCVGLDPDRGYLAWRPTLTETPNFHVPDQFGELEFVSRPRTR